MPKELILASTSPFRQQQMKQLGFSFSAMAPKVDERALESEFTGDVEKLALFLAEKKAQAIFEHKPNALVIGADQVLLFQGKTLSKPESLKQAKERLNRLQGQTHQLLTGLCLMEEGDIFRTTVTATLTMHPLSTQEISDYVDLDQPIGSAGGYKIESAGPRLFEKIETLDFSSIVGLPLLALCTELRYRGFFSP